MITLEKITGKDIYKFSIQDNVDEASMHEFYELLQRKAADHRRIYIIGFIEEIPGFEDMNAFVETVKTKFKGLSVEGKFAIVSDKSWLEILIPIADFLTPDFAIKAFGTDEENNAIEWLEESDAVTLSREDYLNKMHFSRIPDSTIYEFSMDNQVDEPGMLAVREILDKSPDGQNVQLLMSISKFPSFESFKAYYEGLQVNLKFVKSVNRLALLTNREWIAHFTKSGNFVIPSAELEYFSQEDKNEALKWLKK